MLTLVLGMTAQRRRRGGDPWTIGPWVAGSNTVMSFPGTGRVRFARSGGNPRASRHVTNLVPGAQYRVTSTTYAGPNVSTVIFRVATTQNLSTGDLAEQSALGNVDVTFTAPAGGEAYIGAVAVAEANGEYGETDETFTITRIS